MAGKKSRKTVYDYIREWISPTRPNWVVAITGPLPGVPHVPNVMDYIPLGGISGGGFSDGGITNGGISLGGIL